MRYVCVRLASPRGCVCVAAAAPLAVRSELRRVVRGAFGSPPFVVYIIFMLRPDGNLGLRIIVWPVYIMRCCLCTTWSPTRTKMTGVTFGATRRAGFYTAFHSAIVPTPSSPSHSC